MFTFPGSVSITGVVTDLEQPEAPPAPEPDLTDYALYFNRELSWLDFNDRVLQLAEDDSVKLLERLKFCAIYSSNLDEFFMVRVAGMQEYVDGGIDRPREDGRSPAETIAAIGETVREQTRRQTEVLERVLRPALAEHGIRIQTCADVDARHREELGERFRRQIFPVLTPLAVGLGRPFPYISNLSLSLAVLVRDPQTAQETFARVKVPKEMLPRFLPVGDGKTFVPLESLIAEHLDTLFPGMEVIDYDVFRVTRDADFTIDDEADDLLRAVEQELRKRRFGEVVRVEVGAGMSQRLREPLVRALEIEDDELFEVDGLLDLKDLWDVVPRLRVPGAARQAVEPGHPAAAPARRGRGARRPRRDAQGRPARPPPLRLVRDLGRAARRAGRRRPERARDQADRVPHERRLAARPGADPRRPSAASRRSASWSSRPASTSARTSAGRARWRRPASTSSTGSRRSRPTPSASSSSAARATGCATTSTSGPATTTRRPRACTRTSACSPATRRSAPTSPTCSTSSPASPARAGYRRVLIAPAHMRDGIIAEIDRTIEAKQAGQDVRIRMKMNSLVDKRCIRALYRASRAGVPVDLNIRGICCLRPGVPGVSENIRVHSIVGRFLEHSRIYALRASPTRRSS